MAYRVVGRLEREEGGGLLASQVLEFLCRRGRRCSHMNTWRCDIAQSTLTFSSACETQLHCQLHRRVPAPHGPGDSSIHTLLLCITELAIWAASSHIKNDFPLEIGMSDLLFHHLHLHVYLYLYPYLLLCLHQSLSPNKKSKSTHRFGRKRCLPRHSVLLEITSFGP